MACERILLADDGSSAVSLPEVPLLGVLPGTGGLTRLVDKRGVRRDLADVFCTIEEGVKGRRALEWGLVDDLVARSEFAERVRQVALEMASTSDRPASGAAVELVPLERRLEDDGLVYRHLRVELDRDAGLARLVVLGPSEDPPADAGGLAALGASSWCLALARELDDAVLHLRANETELGVLILTSEGHPERVAAWDALLQRESGDWLAREIVLYWKRVLKRLDVSSRTLFALVEPGSCFVGLLAELLFAADRVYMVDGQLAGDDRPAPALRLSESNFGPLPMPNGLTRLETRFLGDRGLLTAARSLVGADLDAARAEEAGLVTMAMDDIDWHDEIRIALEERSSFSPDALTGLEANLRFAGPETLESKIFGRLSAWQNWIFQRPNAVGESGALRRYGSGLRPRFDRRRV